MPRLPGGCHCGRLRYELITTKAPGDLPLRDCVCSFCRRHRARYTSDPSGHVRLLARDARALVRYAFGLATSEMLLCGVCGVYVAAVLTEGAEERAVINTSSLDAPEALTSTVSVEDWSGEDAGSRVARRQRTWTPARLVVVREADAADLPAVRQLFQEYVSWLGIDLSFQGFAEELAGLPGAYAAPLGRILLAESVAGLAGVIALRPLDDDTAELKRLWVRDAARGDGVGRTLTERAIHEARAAGYRRVRLDTLSTPALAPANALYESLGFGDIPAYRHNPHAEARYLELAL